MIGVYRDIRFKIALAAVSGLCCWLVGKYIRIPGESEVLFLLVFLVLPGALFAAGVLFPYLERGRFTFYRGLGLIGISTLSYYSALEVAVGASGSMYGVDTRGFVAASIVGAAIVLTGARLIIPLSRFFALAIAGIPAAVIGGLAFVPTHYSWQVLAYMIWHSLMAVVIHVVENRPLRVGKK